MASQEQTPRTSDRSASHIRDDAAHGAGPVPSEERASGEPFPPAPAATTRPRPSSASAENEAYGPQRTVALPSCPNPESSDPSGSKRTSVASIVVLFGSSMAPASMILPFASTTMPSSPSGKEGGVYVAIPRSPKLLSSVPFGR